MFSRRRFLKAAAASSLSLCVQDLHAQQANQNDNSYDGPFVVVFNASGGWDTTYLMDPKGTAELNHLYQSDQIQSVGNINFAPNSDHITAGAMSNQTFFQRYGTELLVINGIDVSVNNHSPCSRYVATGELDSRLYPTFPALVAACKAPDVPLSFLTFGNYSATGNLVAQTRVPYLRSLQSLETGNYTDITRGREYHHPDTVSMIETKLLEAKRDGHPLRKVAQARRFVHQAQDSSKSLERIIPFIDTHSVNDSFLQQSEIALAAFASGLGVSANLNLSNFDSHNTNDVDQMNLIPKLLAGIDYMLTRAEELNIRDRLIVIIQSEMGRTPWYNNTGGKDHWSVTSMMALGAGISGNRVIGGTRVDTGTGFDQNPVLIDPVTLQESPTGIRIRPEHIQQAQRQLLGIADHPFAQKFALNLPSEENLTGLFSNTN